MRKFLTKKNALLKSVKIGDRYNEDNRLNWAQDPRLLHQTAADLLGEPVTMIKYNSLRRPKHQGAYGLIVTGSKAQTVWLESPALAVKKLQQQRKKWQASGSNLPFILCISEIRGWDCEFGYVSYYEPPKTDPPSLDHMKIIDVDGVEIIGSPEEGTWKHFLELFYYVKEE